ncbi:unnamed protein product [Dibothriocephalus latus]|uniref:Uncharacterized protein n=1 Tax=Dibothriocephalus latus TaxID=60516 RepID=A0A3P7PCA7_DIBLA|nr:unnamed protein product [Dibothriocephalus latus]
MSLYFSLLRLQQQRLLLMTFYVLAHLLLNMPFSKTAVMESNWSNRIGGVLQAEEHVLHVKNDPVKKEVEEPVRAPHLLPSADRWIRLRAPAQLEEHRKVPIGV